MLKANLKSVFFCTLVSTLVFLSGCSSPEEKKTARIEEALSLAEAGNRGEAMEILEALAAQYPNDVDILESIGHVYSAEGDATMAAFFLEQAYLQSPEDPERIFKAYKSLVAAGQPAGHLLEKLATQKPDAMTPELWIRLGQFHQKENKVQAALDAYLKGVDPETMRPAPETAAAIGQLFVKSGNLPQAKNWLEIAADNDDPNALTALFGLLEINLRQKNWPEAEVIIERLNKQFPGAVEASQWQEASRELVRWRKAQDEMKAGLARTEAAEKAATTETVTGSEAAVTGSTSSGSNQGETEPPASGGKAQVIADLEAAESMADAPAVEPGTLEDGTDEEESGKAITFDPGIAIEPADPGITFTADYDEAAVAGKTSYSVESSSMNESAEPAEEAFAGFEIEPGESGLPLTIEELMADAETAQFDRDFKTAIRKYLLAINIANNRAEIWNLLSRAYLIDGQMKNAEITALEAVRIEPREVAYTLDYLRVVQRTKEPEPFLRELETAYARFPASPEITLSLARAHERISQQNETARKLYLRFIDIAPNHPLVPEARAAAAALRAE